MGAVHNIWVRMYSVVLCMGEGDRDAWHEEYMFESTSKAASGDTNMVFGHNLPIFRAHKLCSWGSTG